MDSEHNLKTDSLSPSAFTRADVARMEREEGIRRVASLQEQEHAFLLAESTSMIIKQANLSNLHAQSNRGFKRHTRRIEELERAQRLGFKAGMILDIEKAWCEARLISKLPTYVQRGCFEVDLCPLKYLPAEKEYGPQNSPKVMRARASQLEVIVETEKACASPEEQERKRRLNDKYEQDQARTNAVSVARSIKRRNSFNMEEAEKNRRLADLALQAQARKTAEGVATSIKRRNSIKLEDEERLRRLSDISEQDQARLHARLLADKVQRHYAASEKQKAEDKAIRDSVKIQPKAAPVSQPASSSSSGYLFQSLFKMFGRPEAAIPIPANAPGSPSQ